MNIWRRLEQSSKGGTSSKQGSTQMLLILHMRVFDNWKGNTRKKKQRKLSLKKQLRKRQNKFIFEKMWMRQCPSKR